MQILFLMALFLFGYITFNNLKKQKDVRILKHDIIELLYRKALITTPGVNLMHDFDLKHLYDYNII